jgi:hypothetical protein
VQELEAGALKLGACGCDTRGVLDLEFDRCLGDDPVGRPGANRRDY